MFDARTALAGALTIGALLGLQACDNGPSAVAQRPAQSPQAFASTPSGPSDTPSDDARAQPVRQLAGKPIWSSSRRYSAEENAQRAFDRNGDAFGASSVDDFARKAHAFIDRPPAGVLTLTRAKRRHPALRPQGQYLRRRQPRGRTAHHVQA
ncbi:hypothetical protein [Phenylobacterium sp.]|uniref:hypothetical protein n=1 Tax=Phenylobacterium sp. TaxID=1871053 RepID=UPI00352571AB